MARAGYVSETYTTDFFAINNRSDWDLILSERFQWCPSVFKCFVAFAESLLRYDVFFISFNGFFIGHTPLGRLQALFFRLAGKKVVVIPYGSDAYVYNRISSTTLIHGLLMSYPQYSKQQAQVTRQVEYWVENADVLIPGMMGFDGFGRWDVLIPSQLFIDLDKWIPSEKPAECAEPVYIAHAPNHRGFKGSEFVIEAVATLKSEGLSVELLLIENMNNEEVRKLLKEKVDILVEQLVFTGHGLNGLEGMASGLPTISNLQDDSYTLPLRRWSYFSECPLVSATPENLVDVLRRLVVNPELRQQIGKAGRAYATKYHGLDSAQYLFSNVLDYVHGRKDSLINLYHPLLGAYPSRSPKIEHPLVNNRIVD